MQSCAKAAHWIRALALFEEMPQRGESCGERDFYSHLLFILKGPRLFHQLVSLACFYLFSPSLSMVGVSSKGSKGS